MAIPDQYRHRSVYHFTHVENLEGILEHGLLATREKERLGLKHNSVSLSDIQGRRSTMDVTCGCGGFVHDYVPLYFCKRSSMLLYIVRNKIVDQQFIIYFEFPIKLIDSDACVFCDAAANTESPPNFYSDPSDLEKLNWQAIDNVKWSMPNDRLKQERMAELLVHRNLDISLANRVIVWNDSIKNSVLECYNEVDLSPPNIGFDNIHYFTDFYDTGKHSIVTGPHFIKKAYKKAARFIVENLGRHSAPQFPKLNDLRKALRKNLACIPETDELIGLETDNEVHDGDVGTHTLEVVKRLGGLSEFRNMDPMDQLITEVAAYLHDIGKGPKSRWEHNSGKQKVDPDHPIKALPMLEEILTEYIGTIRKRPAQLICKLVCYHDLVGDIIGKGRRIEELVEIVDDERELNMLIAIAKADIMAINAVWLDENKIQELREKVVEYLK